MNFTVPCILLPLLSTRAVKCSFNGFVTIIISACQSDNGVDCTPNTDEKYKTETNKEENDSLTQWFTGVQTWAILVDRDIVDMGIRPWVCPDVVKAKSSQPLKKYQRKSKTRRQFNAKYKIKDENQKYKSAPQKKNKVN